MMRVAIFIDGKNFYAGWKDKAEGTKIDFTKLANWLVSKTCGDRMWGAHYYTGVETGANALSDGQQKLVSFLDMIELQPGFFVKRFPRKSQVFKCEHCNKENHYTQEKEVDTTMVADMLRMAAVNAFDIMILISGDADHTPALEGVQAIGKQAYAATWGGVGLSNRIRKAAFDHIDLLNGLDIFGYHDLPAVHLPKYKAESENEIFLGEIVKAQMKFDGGYLGTNYFITRWDSEIIPTSPDKRRETIDKLLEMDLVEIYDAPDGKKAIRVKHSTRPGE